MKTFVVGLILGILIGAGGVYYMNRDRAEHDLDRAGSSVSESAGKIKSTVQEKIGEIKTEDIKEELSKTGVIIREKAKQAGAAISDATANARITTAIKAKLSTEVGVNSIANISVDTTDGVVTLAGFVGSHDHIAKAVRIAEETEGVQKVVSTLQVKTTPK